MKFLYKNQSIKRTQWCFNETPTGPIEADPIAETETTELSGPAINAQLDRVGQEGLLLSPDQFPHPEAREIGELTRQVEVAAVKAVVAVESAGQMNATRFEPHIHARYPNTPEPTRTQMSTSYGAFQIMGFNHEVAGFSSPQAMIDAMATPQGQLQAFAGFIESNPRIHTALENRDWPTFAHGYNGAGYRANRYDEKMAAAYRRYSQESPTT